jgi:hypothetical protein
MPPQALTASSSVATPALFAKLCIAFIVVHLSKTSVKTPCLTSRLIDKFTEAGGAQVPWLAGSFSVFPSACFGKPPSFLLFVANQYSGFVLNFSCEIFDLDHA